MPKQEKISNDNAPLKQIAKDIFATWLPYSGGDFLRAYSPILTVREMSQILRFLFDMVEREKDGKKKKALSDNLQEMQRVFHEKIAQYDGYGALFFHSPEEKFLSIKIISFLVAFLQARRHKIEDIFQVFLSQYGAYKKEEVLQLLRVAQQIVKSLLVRDENLRGNVAATIDYLISKINLSPEGSWGQDRVKATEAADVLARKLRFLSALFDR